MKYTLNDVLVEYELNQETTSDFNRPYKHIDLINPAAPWYKKGYTPIVLTKSFMQKVRRETNNYLQHCLHKLGFGNIDEFSNKYHEYFKENKKHLSFLTTIGKVLPPQKLGIDTDYLEDKVKKISGWQRDVTCNKVCDIRVFRPYKGEMMDNNPLHRDTWKRLVTNCVNMYIPVMGNNEKSSLALIEQSHLWDRALIERTKENAYFNNVQYGIPAISKIKSNFQVIRPYLNTNEVLLFSSDIIHGGSVNLNENQTRVSIEIRFWEKP